MPHPSVRVTHTPPRHTCGTSMVPSSHDDVDPIDGTPADFPWLCPRCMIVTP